MNFNLVDNWFDLTVSKYIQKLGCRAVTDSDRLDQPFLHKFFHLLPHILNRSSLLDLDFGETCIPFYLRNRPMYKVEVKVLNLKLVETSFHGSSHVFVLASPEFCSDEDFFSFNALVETVIKCSSNADLVFVNPSSVNVSVAVFKDSFFDDCLNFLIF